LSNIIKWGDIMQGNGYNWGKGECNMATLDTALAHFDLDAGRGLFCFVPTDERLPGVFDARFGLAYRCGQRGGAHPVWNGAQAVVETLRIDTRLGPAQGVQATMGPDGHGLVTTATFAVLPERPFLLWKLTLHNRGEQAVHAGCSDLLHGIVRWRQAVSPSRADLAFFANGWQSWSFSGAYAAGAAQRSSRLFFIPNAYCHNPSTPRPGRAGHFSGDFFGVIGDRARRTALLAGFLSQREQFGSLEGWLQEDAPRLRLLSSGDRALVPPGGELSSDWAVLYAFDLDCPDPLAPYVEAVALEHGVGQPRPAVSGWCSWYHFYERVTAQQVRDNLKQVNDQQQRLPLELVQIDDGFELQVGEWFTCKKSFPEGVAPLAAEIRAAGRTAGLWLAPFLVSRQATLYHRHPECILHSRARQPVTGAFIGNQFVTALDMSHPRAQDEVRRLIGAAVREWGFPYLKLDFLYAAALDGVYHDAQLTRAQVLRRALELMRAAAGEETFLLGCGLPLGSGIGVVQGMRIGADTNDTWRPHFHGVKMVFGAEPSMPSATNALQNVLTRAALHRRWWLNDPDCLLLRPGTSLTPDELQSQATAMGMASGMLLLSDDLAQVPDDRRRIAEVLLPLINRTPWVLDWLDATTPQRLRLDLEGASGVWSLLAWFNWSDQAAEVTVQPEAYHLPAGEYWARSFWAGETRLLPAGQGWQAQVAPHGVVLLAMRLRQDGQAQYLGSDLHLSQGLEVERWQVMADEVHLGLALGRHGEGQVELYLPQAPKHAWLDGQAVSWTDEGEGRYRFALELNPNAELQLAF